MVKLYFIRHGKTEWNLEGRYQGANGDSPLLKQSYTEIQQLITALKTTQFAAIYSSPIKRAKDTADLLNAGLNQGLSVVLDAHLEEFHLGKMEGMAFTDVAVKYPAELDAFRNHPDKYDPKNINGETFETLLARMVPTIKKIVAQNNVDANILIVSHGAALGALIQTLLGVPLKDLRKHGGLSNTSTTILETKNGTDFNLIKWNDTSYLDRERDESDVV
ncbi:histidine phosphatase family protein [Dellaglioa sp. L3N]